MAKNNKDINNINFKAINDDYSWGNYGNFKVIVMKKNGYINATNLIQLASKNKKIDDWLGEEDTHEFIDAMSLYMNLSVDKLLITPENVPDNIAGTYVHPDLIPHIASWASPQFAVNLSRTVNKHFIKKALREKKN